MQKITWMQDTPKEKPCIDKRTGSERNNSLSIILVYVRLYIPFKKNILTTVAKIHPDSASDDPSNTRQLI